MHLTLIDGKILSHITNSKSMAQCPICHKKSAEFGLPNRSTKINPEHLKFGLSPLHCWLRMYEFLLNIAYRLDFKKYAVYSRNAEDKRLFLQTKSRIQQEMRDKLGLLVDIVKSGGFGNTNDGNSARKAFSNYKIFAEILRLDEDFVRKIRNILVTISLPFEIDSGKFGEYCESILSIYREKYSWFKLSTTAHKLLSHGSEIIKESILPIGMMSEEAAEARHKLLKRDRLYHARKINRVANMLDVFHRAIDSSDPLISQKLVMSRSKGKQKLPLPADVVSLLREPVFSTENQAESQLGEEGEGTEEVVLDMGEFDVLLDNFVLEVEVETTEP